MNVELIKEIDSCFIPTFAKYIKEQLIGAIYTYLTEDNVNSFTDENSSRERIKKIGKNKILEALMMHVVKLDAYTNIKATRGIVDFSKNYTNHSIGESELRLFETLSLSVTDVFNKTAIKDAEKILLSDYKALYNVIYSFVDYRYVKNRIAELEKKYYDSELHLAIIREIEEYYIRKENV